MFLSQKGSSWRDALRPGMDDFKIQGMKFMLLACLLMVSGVGCLWGLHMRREMLRAREAEHAAREYAAQASHELRTALSAVAGMCGLVCQTNRAPEERGEELRRLQAVSRCAVELASTVLDRSCMEQGTFQVHHAALSLVRLAEDTLAMVQAQAECAGVSLSSEIHVRHSWVWGDETRLRQVLVNLAVNAVKWTPAGGRVCLTIRENCGDYVFSVTDTGCGIDPADRERIFRRYEQGRKEEGAGAGSFHGAGIGLAISREIVDRLGGRLSVESEPEKGSRFFFALSLPASGCPVERERACAVPLAGKRVLLAEDNGLSAEITAAQLERGGAQVEKAADGCEALKRFSQSGEGAFALILADMHMPGMDGPEMARAIRQTRRRDAQTVRIIALSAGTTQEERRLALAAGMDGYLLKPLDIAQLEKILMAGRDRLFTTGAEDSTGASAGHPA